MSMQDKMMPASRAGYANSYLDGLALVEARFDAEFRAALAAHGLTVTRSAEIRGLNYSRGQEVTIAVYARR